MKISVLLAVVTLSLSVTGCSSSMFGSKGESTAATTAISAAKNSQKAAKKVGFEWRDMGKMIKQAEKAAKSGDNKKAIKIANAVVKQGEQAQLQAKVAKTAGPSF